MDAFYLGIFDGLTRILRWEKLADHSEWKQELRPSHGDNALAYGKSDEVGFIVDI